MLTPEVSRFLSEISDPNQDANPSLEVRIRTAADLEPTDANMPEVWWDSDLKGITEVTWSGAGKISGIDGSGVLNVSLREHPSTGWMIRTAAGSAACVSGRVLGLHGCVLRSPDGNTVLLLGPGGSGKTSLSLWLVAWMDYHLIVEDFVYLRHDWSAVTAPVRDFLNLRRWTWDLLKEAPKTRLRTSESFPDGIHQVRVPLDKWLYPTEERVIVDSVVAVRRTNARQSSFIPEIDLVSALIQAQEISMTEWISRFSIFQPEPQTMPSAFRPAGGLTLGLDWSSDIDWLYKFEEMVNAGASRN